MISRCNSARQLNTVDVQFALGRDDVIIFAKHTKYSADGLSITLFHQFLWGTIGVGWGGGGG